MLMAVSGGAAICIWNGGQLAVVACVLLESVSFDVCTLILMRAR